MSLHILPKNKSEYGITSLSEI
ncbi:hypothetical protein BCEP4_760012 [Burkholderia cepacia]|nr:hypothetical protein BCEP4_760012 [Burkholderia cepacia]